MKVVLLCGGFGTRLQEETEVKPKPMIEIGRKPILWHIMKNYESQGFNNFVVALGYKGELIKEYFMHYRYRFGNMSIRLKTGDVMESGAPDEDWLIHLLDTGLHTQTGGRVKRAAQYIGNDAFMMTYGDGLSNVNLAKLLEFHKSHGKLATMTAVRPPARFGGISLSGDHVVRFEEKPQIGEGWINGGFFIFESKIIEYIERDETILEREPLERLAKEGQLMAYRHEGFWQCMDTLRDVRLLEALWEKGTPAWKNWE